LQIGQDYKILTGPIFKLTCDVDGEPKPVIKWRRDGKEIPNNKNTEYEINTKDLNKSGYYTCVAANAFGSLTSSSNVDILGKFFVFLFYNLKNSLTASNAYKRHDVMPSSDFGKIF